jgi:hypothetical protein
LKERIARGGKQVAVVQTSKLCRAVNWKLLEKKGGNCWKEAERTEKVEEASENGEKFSKQKHVISSFNFGQFLRFGEKKTAECGRRCSSITACFVHFHSVRRGGMSTEQKVQNTVLLMLRQCSKTGKMLDE